ncbi:MAG: hypothetical protein KDE22_01245 [Rhodobacterales bacterium]|nr:hypothetical protein [Rhodobacterales bacterium]
MTMLNNGDPTPEQRAEVVVRRLEQFIREGRTPEGGMPFRKWQDMARAEITATVLEAERVWRAERDATNRFLVVGAAAVVSVGFWGTAVAIDGALRFIDSGVMLMAGGLFLFGLAGLYGLWRAARRIRAGRRIERLTHVANLDRQLRHLDKDLEARVKELEKATTAALDAAVKARVKAGTRNDPAPAAPSRLALTSLESLAESLARPASGR